MKPCCVFIGDTKICYPQAEEIARDEEQKKNKEESQQHSAPGVTSKHTATILPVEDLIEGCNGNDRISKIRSTNCS
jgi:hypothetical protein